MKKKLAIAVCVALLVGSPLSTALALSDLATAAQPLADGVPQVAVVRLRELLAQKLPEDVRIAATAKLVEALIAAEKPAEALDLLAQPEMRGMPGAKFQQAQALAALARWAEALPLYQQTASDPSSRARGDALFGQAEALRALGRVDEAISAYRLAERDARWTTRARFRAVELLLEKQDVEGAGRLLDAVQPKATTERKERRLLRGRIAAKRSRDRANSLYASILRNPEGTPHSVLVATLFALAEAHLQSHTPGTGGSFLEDFIERYPGDPDLPAIFAKLDQLYSAERKPARHELGRWSNDPGQPRRALAQWYLARANLRLGRRDLALQSFEQLRVTHPALPELAAAFLEYAQLQRVDGAFDRTIETIEAARALSPSTALRQRIEIAAGATRYKEQGFDAAAQIFRQLAKERTAIGNEALFNASLAWMQAGDAPHLAAAKQELRERGADDTARGDLQLEQGLLEAGQGDVKAAVSLQTFAREFPKHARLAEAFVALAEIAFHAAPPRVDEARQALARAAASAPTPAARERADYLAIWIEDSGEGATDGQKVIALAEDFLRQYPDSTLEPGVRLKLAETYYRQQDFASAQTQFEILAQHNPKAPAAEQALFFAAQSAAQTMAATSLERALMLFDEVVQRNGEMKWAARNEQAVLERKLGKPQDAITLYEEVLGRDASPADKREALCGKGDVLYELGGNAAENYRRAIPLYDQLADEPKGPTHWRNQALFKKGICLEKLAEPAEALATFYRVLEDEARPGRRREYFWFYKAGFNAARLLEQASQWQPAATVYEKLAFAGGARSEEAKARLNRLRLEHFLWEQ